MITQKSESGITLIALVITIIVLLILAGIAISMLSGENGILRQAANAKTETEKKSTEEQVKLAAMDALMRGKDLTKIEDKEHLKDALTSQGLIIPEEKVTGDETTGYTVDVGEMIYVVAPTGTVREKTMVTDIKAVNYGDYISGYKDLTDIEGTDKDWQVFYNDGKNVWIIASYCVGLDAITKQNTGMSTSGYYSWWDGYSINEPDMKMGYRGANCAATLADYSKWEMFLDDNGLGLKAIGGPDIEMFANSYNAKYPNLNKGKIECKKITDENTIGYQVRWSKDTDETWKTYVAGLNDDNSNNMYVILPENEAGDGPSGYYLCAAPHEDDYNIYIMERGSGQLGSNYFYDESINGVRPVVCLNSDVKATPTTDKETNITTWTIDK